MMSCRQRITVFLQKMYQALSARRLSTRALLALFTLQKGTRQGCPLLPLLFNLALEPLSLFIYSVSALTAIKVGSEEIGSAMFTDDILLLTSQSKRDILYVKTILKVSGSSPDSK